jgi:uncharacterized protein YmfQ (DUF2313 family)
VSAAYQAALAALAEVRATLAREDIGPDERAQALMEFDRILGTLQREDHRVSTQMLARRVQQLDAQLRDRGPSERNRILMQRLGLSRSRIYELRNVQLTPDGGPV